MKVLFCVRHNFNTAPGGAQIQILKTIKYLKKLGVDCDLTTSPFNINYCNYDIIHLTDLTWVYDNLSYLKEIRKQGYEGKKVLSTIYWPFDEYASVGAPLSQKLIYKMFGINGFEFAKAFAKFFSKGDPMYLNGVKRGYIENQILIASSVDWLLPNSESEMIALNQRLKLDFQNYSVVNNAIDTKIFDDIILSKEISKNENLVTFVARIDPRKNQLDFLRSMMETDCTIRFIGNAGPNSGKYFNKLTELAGKRGNVEFISHISQEEVFKNMLEAKVNVLPSWVETPGLVSIEAAYAGCNIVVSDKGSVTDYFGDFAFYCQPDDLDSMKQQTLRALQSTHAGSFKNIIKDNFSWEKTAEQTLNSYHNLLM